MTCSVSRSLTQWKYCSLWIGIASDSVHNMGANIWICLVYVITSVIAYQLWQTHFIQLIREKRIRYHRTEFWRNSSTFACQWGQFGTIFRFTYTKTRLRKVSKNVPICIFSSSYTPLNDPVDTWVHGVCALRDTIRSKLRLCAFFTTFDVLGLKPMIWWAHLPSILATRPPLLLVYPYIWDLYVNR